MHCGHCRNYTSICKFAQEKIFKFFSHAATFFLHFFFAREKILIFLNFQKIAPFKNAGLFLNLQDFLNFSS